MVTNLRGYVHEENILNDVLTILGEIATSIQYNGFVLNERYLHHYFSHRIQEKYPIMNLLEQETILKLHPEWPTYKETTQISYGRYRKEGKYYQPNSNGTAGFIDFAMGDYDKPTIGIEFSLKYGWANEEIVYDFLKMLDDKNPFFASISLNIIFRKNGLVSGGYLRDLEVHMNNACKEAIRRLDKSVCDFSTRKIYFMIIEIDQDNQRRDWAFDPTERRFKISQITQPA